MSIHSDMEILSDMLNGEESPYGDIIEVDVNKGIMNLLVDEDTINQRLKNYKPILPEVKSGYQKMYVDHVMQADKGADLDFLVGKRGSEVKRHSH